MSRRRRAYADSKGIFCGTSGMQVMMRFDGTYWVLEDAWPQVKGEVTLTGNALTASLTELNAVAKLTHDGGAIVYTLPQNTSVAIPIGSVGEIWHEGTSTLAIAAGAGVTVTSRGGMLNSAGTGARLFWQKVDT